MLRALLLAAILITSLAAGCSKASLGAACSEHADCQEGLFCMQAGSLAGTCTTPCGAQPSVCEARFGNDATCHGDFCARYCGEAKTDRAPPPPACPEGTSCRGQACTRHGP